MPTKCEFLPTIHKSRSIKRQQQAAYPATLAPILLTSFYDENNKFLLTTCISKGHCARTIQQTLTCEIPLDCIGEHFSGKAFEFMGAVATVSRQLMLFLLKRSLSQEYHEYLAGITKLYIYKSSSKLMVFFVVKTEVWSTT